MNRLKGFIYELATSVTFGLIPLFTLPLMQGGMSLDSILFYRFLFATLALAGMMKLHKEPFGIEGRDIPFLLLLAGFYTASALFLFWGYDFMGAGVATTLHFTYPVFVTLLMLVLFRERASWVTWAAIVLAIYGVAKLSLKGGELVLDPMGMVIVLHHSIQLYYPLSCDCFPGSCQHHRGCSVPDESAENRAQIPDSDPPGSYLRNPLPVCWKANYLVYGTSCIGCGCQQFVWSQGVIYRDTLVPNPWDSG